MTNTNTTTATVINETAENKDLASINLEGDVFIIPNSICSWPEEYFKLEEPDARVERDQKTCKVNNIDFNSETLFVQVWMTSERSENWTDHTVHLGDDSILRHIPSHLPTKLFEGKKEGETVVVYLPAIVEKGHKNPSRTEVIFKATLTLAQTKYRYRNFGTFEECISRLMGHTSHWL